MLLLLASVFFIKSPINIWINPPTDIPAKYFTKIADEEFDGYGLVTSVADGDTITINESEKVRLLGIDTPELSHPAQRIREECYGRAAKARLEQLVLYKYVYLEKGKRDKDKYKRSLRYVYLPSFENDETKLLINAYLVGEGFARSYILEKNDPYKDVINAYQADAKENKKGLWGSCDREKFRW